MCLCVPVCVLTSSFIPGLFALHPSVQVKNHLPAGVWVHVACPLHPQDLSPRPHPFIPSLTHILCFSPISPAPGHGVIFWHGQPLFLHKADPAQWWGHSGRWECGHIRSWKTEAWRRKLRPTGWGGGAWKDVPSTGRAGASRELVRQQPGAASRGRCF